MQTFFKITENNFLDIFSEYRATFDTHADKEKLEKQVVSFLSHDFCVLKFKKFNLMFLLSFAILYRSSEFKFG